MGCSDTIKSWIYKFALVALLLNLYAEVFSTKLLNILSWVVAFVFIIDIGYMIVSFCSTINEGEWSALAFFSLIFNIAAFSVSAYIFFNPSIFFTFIHANKAIPENFQIWWLGTCIVLYNTVSELTMLPLDLISSFSDE